MQYRRPGNDVRLLVPQLVNKYTFVLNDQGTITWFVYYVKPDFLCGFWTYSCLFVSNVLNRKSVIMIWWRSSVIRSLITEVETGRCLLGIKHPRTWWNIEICDPSSNKLECPKMEPSVAGAVAVSGRREKRVIPREKSRKGGAKSLSRLERRRRITCRIMLTVHFAASINSSHVPKQVHGLRAGPVWRVWSYCRRRFGSKGQYCLPSISPTLQLLVSGFDPLQMCSGPAAPSLRCGQQLLWHLQTATELTKWWINDKRSARTTLEGNKA